MFRFLSEKLLISSLQFFPSDFMSERPRAVIIVAALLVAWLNIFPIADVGAGPGHLKVDLQNTDASFVGLMAQDYAGYAVTVAGDVNGDGYDDLIIGASSWQQAGEAYLILGGPSGWKMRTSLSQANASFLAESANDMLGGGSAGGCDVNGDGYDDILIGAADNSEVAQMSGEVYLVLGKPSGWAMDTPINTAAVASFRGEAYMHYAGQYLSCAEDINGDGLDDILIGVPASSYTGTIAGQTYIFFGKKTGWAMDTSLASADASIVGETVGDGSGGTVKGVGDVNGDGLGDLIIGAAGNIDGGGQDGDVNNQAGQVYVIFGRKTGWSMHMPIYNANGSYWGQVDDHLGWAISGAGDVNGDGLNDILIGSPYTNAQHNRQGKANLILGKKLGWAMDLGLAASCDASFIGLMPPDTTGFSVASAGDFNGDGYDDIIIAARSIDHTAYIVFGKPKDWSRDMDLTNADIRFNGTWNPNSMSSGDVNGDGLSDVLIGDAYDDTAASNAGQAYLTFGFTPSEPTAILSVKAYREVDCINETNYADVHQTIYVKVNASGGDPNRIDTITINVSSDRSLPRGFDARLYETGLDNNTFIGAVTIDIRTDAGNRWIEAAPGEHVIVSAKKAPAKRAVVLVGGFKIVPAKDKDNAVEDMLYKVKFSIENGTDASMTFDSNASWLSFNNTSHEVTGTPNNTQVGPWWVRIKANDGFGNSAVHQYELKVINALPLITTVSITKIFEDQRYWTDYNSSDDSQGIITWHLQTNATWLSIDQRTGILSGTPTNNDTGYYNVKVGVDDGNGGFSWANFTLLVVNIEDAPRITNKDTTVATEDKLYSVKYNATDEDLGDIKFTWSIRSNASWLQIDEHLGLLYGTPNNGDVGSCYVNVTVQDRTYLEDHHNFTIVVRNAPPRILTKDVTTATEDKAYVVHYTSDDDGPGTTWHLATNAKWLTMDAATGNLSGMPRNDDVGKYPVEVSVNDGHGGLSKTNFTLTVLNANDPPVISSAPALNATVDSAYEYQVKATDVDKGDVLNYSLAGSPAGMAINATTGLLTWVPKDGQEGAQSVSVGVSDGNVTVLQNFTVTVEPHLVVTIVKPTEGQKVSGKLTATGTAKGPGDLVVEVNIDGAGWKPAEGNSTWTYHLDTSNMKEGKHTMQVRASWKGHTSEVRTATFEVRRAQTLNLTAMVLIGLLVAIIAVAVAVVLVMTRRRRKVQ